MLSWFSRPAAPDELTGEVNAGQTEDPSWETQAKAKAESTKSKTPREWRLSQEALELAKAQTDLTGSFIEAHLTESEKMITSWTATEIVAKIRTGAVTSAQVATSYCKRASIAHEINNCLHEIFFDQALERARHLDALQAQGHVLGPLHGLPISLKDQFHVAGVQTTMGYVGWIDTFEGKTGTGKDMAVNSQIVSELLKLGAILYCKTSLPQTLLLGETHNNIIGYTMNPRRQHLSCGGSSGGEGALLALGGSCLGVGTDIGGSVRIPASFCGVYSIKPSLKRFSYKDVANSNPGQMIAQSAVGFMSTSLTSLKLIMTSLLTTEPWKNDPEVVPIPWRPGNEMLLHRFGSIGAEKPLCFGILSCDGVVRPHPPITRALELVTRLLRQAGHEIVTWGPPSHEYGADIHRKLINCDGNHNIWDQLRLSGEPPVSEMTDLGSGPRAPMPLLEFQDLCLRRVQYRADYAAYWNSTSGISTGRPVDAVIMPVAPHAAVMPGKYCHYASELLDLGYTEIVNLLDYTSVAIPTGFVDSLVDKPDLSYKPMNETDRQNWESYDAEQYHGAPIGIQVVGRQYEEERVFSIASVVDDIVRKDMTDDR